MIMPLAEKPTLRGRPRLSLPGRTAAPLPEPPPPVPPASEPPRATSDALSRPFRERTAAELAAILGVAVEALPRILVGAVPAPLKGGIRDDIAARYPAADPVAIGRWLGQRCRTEQYRRAIAAGGSRYDLDGHQAGEITESERAWVRR